MRAPVDRTLLIHLALASLVLAAPAPALEVAVAHPPRRGAAAASSCGVFVAGSAHVLPAAGGPFDLALVLDASRSSGEPSGADVDGDGRIGRPELAGAGPGFASSDPDDSILAAQVAAARTLLSRLHRGSTRVALVTFGGGAAAPDREPPALTWVPLTRDYARIEEALDAVLRRGAAGGTHTAAAIDEARRVLTGDGAPSGDGPRERVALFFSDGQVSLPHGPGPGSAARNLLAVLRATERAARARVRIHAFAIGPEALDAPIAPVEMAERSAGAFVPVRRPGALVRVIEDVSLAGLRDLRLHSVTTGAAARHLWAGADGFWAGLVDARPGPNRLEVAARAEDGSERSRVLEIRVTSAGAASSIPGGLLGARNELLEECLRRLRSARAEAEQRYADRMREQLRLEIERERALALERAEDQRRQLDFDIEG